MNAVTQGLRVEGRGSRGGRQRAAGGAASGRSGWGGRGTAGLARLLMCVPFRRDRLSRAAVFHSPRRLAALLGPCRRSRPSVAGETGRRNVLPPWAVAVPSRARGEQVDAIHRRPRGPPDSPPPGLHRSTTARRHRGTWIRRPPRRRDGPDCKGSAFSGGQIASRKCDVSDVAGEFCDNRTIDPRIASKRRSLFPRMEGSSRRTRRDHRGHGGAGGPDAPVRALFLDEGGPDCPRR